MVINKLPSNNVIVEEQNITQISKEPLFNPALDYLKTLSDLRKQIHISRALNNIPLNHILLCELYSEVKPRFTDLQISEMETHKKKCDNLMNSAQRMSGSSGVNRICKDALYKWFEVMNLYMHRQGLGMPNKPGFDEAFKI